MFMPDEYSLLDFGGGRKLERFGPYILDRPCVEAESDMIREKMTHAIPLDVPLAVDIDSGLNWLESK